jgi:hypothetical protein
MRKKYEMIEIVQFMKSIAALRASFSFLKATSRFALLSLPNLLVSGENLNLWAAVALQRRSLLEGVALRQWGGG